ncbi:MAG: helix-turn-helix domain-containing protein [Gemmataceae bacterium]
MSERHIRRKTERTPEEAAALREMRERLHREKKTPESAGARLVPLGQLMHLREVAFRLKQERERLGLTLADLSERTGIDQASLSRLESGKNANPTLGTLSRVAAALGGIIRCAFEPTPVTDASALATSTP